MSFIITIKKKEKKRNFFFLHTQWKEVNKYHKNIKTPILWPNTPKLLVKDIFFLEGWMKYEIVWRVFWTYYLLFVLMEFYVSTTQKEEWEKDNQRRTKRDKEEKNVIKGVQEKRKRGSNFISLKKGLVGTFIAVPLWGLL
jgi:hypothetical protein